MANPKKASTPVEDKAGATTKRKRTDVVEDIVTLTPTVPSVPAQRQTVTASEATAPENVSSVPMRALLVAGKSSPALIAPTKDKYGWTDSRRRYTIAYLAKLQLIMRLADWEIVVNFEQNADEDCLAEIKAVEQQRRAELVFGKQFFTISSYDQRQTLVHEFMHLHTALLEEMTREAIDAGMGKRALKAFGGAYMCESERVVDGLADVLSPLLEPYELPAR